MDCILFQVVRCNGVEVLPYKQDLVDILKPCVGLKSKRAFHFAAKVSRYENDDWNISYEH